MYTSDAGRAPGLSEGPGAPEAPSRSEDVATFVIYIYIYMYKYI